MDSQRILYGENNDDSSSIEIIEKIDIVENAPPELSFQIIDYLVDKQRVLLESISTHWKQIADDPIFWAKKFYDVEPSFRKYREIFSTKVPKEEFSKSLKDVVDSIFPKSWEKDLTEQKDFEKLSSKKVKLEIDEREKLFLYSDNSLNFHLLTKALFERQKEAFQTLADFLQSSSLTGKNSKKVVIPSSLTSLDSLLPTLPFSPISKESDDEYDSDTDTDISSTFSEYDPLSGCESSSENDPRLEKDTPLSSSASSSPFSNESSKRKNDSGGSFPFLIDKFLSEKDPDLKQEYQKRKDFFVDALIDMERQLSPKSGHRIHREQDGEELREMERAEATAHIDYGNILYEAVWQENNEVIDILLNLEGYENLVISKNPYILERILSIAASKGLYDLFSKIHESFSSFEKYQDLYREGDFRGKILRNGVFSSNLDFVKKLCQIDGFCRGLPTMGPGSYFEVINAAAFSGDGKNEIFYFLIDEMKFLEILNKSEIMNENEMLLLPEIMLKAAKGGNLSLFNDFFSKKECRDFSQEGGNFTYGSVIFSLLQGYFFERDTTKREKIKSFLLERVGERDLVRGLFNDEVHGYNFLIRYLEDILKESDDRGLQEILAALKSSMREGCR